MLGRILTELSRIEAFDIRVTMYRDTPAEPEQYVRIQTDNALWHVKPDQFLKLLKQLPDQAGNEAVRLAVETHEHFSSWRNSPANKPPPFAS